MPSGSWSGTPSLIGMPPDDAGGGAGGIEQNPVETVAVPPSGKVGGVGDGKFGLQTQAREILFDHPGAVGIAL